MKLKKNWSVSKTIAVAKLSGRNFSQFVHSSDSVQGTAYIAKDYIIFPSWI